MQQHRGALILVFGILGLLVCIIFAPIAWLLGNADLKEIREGRMDPSGEGLTNAGRILGIIGTVLFLGVIVLVLFGFLLMAVFASVAA
jgi:hypothetical protein